MIESQQMQKTCFCVKPLDNIFYGLQAMKENI